MPKNIIEAQAVHKTYALDGTQVEVLRGLDFRLDAGESAAIIGPSGAGKSTLLHILGLLEQLTSGSLRFMDLDTGKMSDADRSKLRLEQVGFVFQFHHLLPEFSALENVMMPGLMKDSNKIDCRNRAGSLLEQAGIADRLNHKPGELSGGEQQRVALARALMNQPALLLADEPTGNLDKAASLVMQQMMAELVSQTGAAMLIVTHNEDLAAMTGKVYKMEEGTLQPV